MGSTSLLEAWRDIFCDNIGYKVELLDNYIKGLEEGALYDIHIITIRYGCNQNGRDKVKDEVWKKLLNSKEYQSLIL